MPELIAGLDSFFRPPTERAMTGPARAYLAKRLAPALAQEG